MTKKLFFLIILFSVLGVSSACKALEINYPEINGVILSEETSLPEVVKYIFNFSIWALGIVGFAVLTWTGIRYLTSSGNPTIRKDSIKQFKAAVLGIAILLGSYLILTTINPQLRVLGTSELEKVPIPAPVSPTKLVSPDPLVRIKNLAETILISSSALEIESNNIQPIIEEECDCASSSAQCDCAGETVSGFKGLECTKIRCYGDPCKNRDKVEDQQSKIMVRIEEILYYRNRMISEKEDIGPELEQFIYWGRLTEEGAEELKTQIEELISLSDIFSTDSNYLIKKTTGDPSPSGACKTVCCNTYLGLGVDVCCPPEGCHNSSGCNEGYCEGEPYPDIPNILDKIKEDKNKIDEVCNNIISILE